MSHGKANLSVVDLTPLIRRSQDELDEATRLLLYWHDRLEIAQLLHSAIFDEEGLADLIMSQLGVSTAATNTTAEATGSLVDATIVSPVASDAASQGDRDSDVVGGSNGNEGNMDRTQGGGEDTDGSRRECVEDGVEDATKMIDAMDIN
ncbi:hypothetical protein HDU76_008546 [Blyttiomyces sp. JEL0837]|nr:hypothetical protein HDU76_008546 [Blyttiomyces sp. JEL0837]